MAEVEVPERPDDVDGDDAYCYRCGGSGEIVVCCDDLCNGLGQCIHGDGEIICPECGGE